ncbi:hypothetical protein SAMN04487950_3572 [Halogranum rubrum]|uniref:Uncharacterized protein n=1 Tax=Halogranum rubrum TaxID=553466 RepID=A0A1I4H8B0_9EURY|nr:hypothetical protein [Halogranum rubrum]SFL38518.1 hypothetical protein SAMN04487950_3572 [Halogranum rubrum]
MKVTRSAGRLVGRLVGRAERLVSTRELLLAVGTLSFLLAVAVALLPAAYVPAAVTWTAGTLVANRSTVLFAGAVAGGFGVWALYRGSAGEDDADPVEFPTRPPEFAYYDERRTVGGAIDLATSDEDLPDWKAGRSRRDTRTQLHDAAVAVITEREGCSPQVARDAIAVGTWTDSPRAARFLGGTDAADLPLSVRIRDWASGDSYRRHVEATVDEIAALDGGERR